MVMKKESSYKEFAFATIGFIICLILAIVA